MRHLSIEVGHLRLRQLFSDGFSGSIVIGMTNEEVAGLLDVLIEDVEALADELDVPDDEWTVEDVNEAADLLEDDDADDDD